MISRYVQNYIQFIRQWLISSQLAEGTKKTYTIDSVIYADNYTCNVRDVAHNNNIQETPISRGFKCLFLSPESPSRGKFCLLR